MMSSRKERRLESKKRKAIAFLNLVKGSNEPLPKSTDAKDGGGTAPKKPKVLQSDTGKASSEKVKVLHTNDEVYKEGIRLIRERQKASMQRPKIFLTMDELTRNFPGLEAPGEVKRPPPLFMADVQHLISYAEQQLQASSLPRWCRLLRPAKVSKVVVVVLESVSSTEIEQYPDSLATLNTAFDIHVEMVSPLQYGSSVREDLLNSPMSIRQVKDRMCKGSKQGILDKRIGPNIDTTSLIDSYRITKQIIDTPLISFDELAMRRQQQLDEAVGKTDMTGEYVSTYTLDVVNRTALLLNPQQILCENIPMPTAKATESYHDFVFTKKSYASVTDKSPLFAVDCEMVQTKASQMDLARITIVNEQLETVYDSFVRPYAPVTDYVTRFSGITKQILDNVFIRIEDIQKTIQLALPSDAILCGQSIGSDLRSMKMFHPYLIDTSVIYNLTGDRRKKTGLRKLADYFLGQSIQKGQTGHCSEEDAKATMELVLLKLRNGIAFGDSLIPYTGPATNKKSCDKSSSSEPDNVKLCDQLSTNEPIGSVQGQIAEPGTVQISTKEELNKEANQICDKCTLPIADTNAAMYDTHVTGDKKRCDSTSETCNCYKILDKDGAKNKNLVMTAKMKLNDAETKQRRSFFQREGGMFVENFFQVLERCKKTGRIIDEEESSDLYPDLVHPCLLTSDTDKGRSKLTQEALSDIDFALTHLYGYRDFLETGVEDEEEKKKVLWKLDRRFWQILTSLPANSLFIVVLPGREIDGVIHQAMTFVKVVV